MEIATKLRDALTRAVRGIGVDLDDLDRFRLARALSGAIERDDGYLAGDLAALLLGAHERPVGLRDEMGELAVITAIARGANIVGARLDFSGSPLCVKVERDPVDGSLALWLRYSGGGDLLRLADLEPGEVAHRPASHERAHLSF